MKGFIEELIERAKRSKVFKRNKKSLELKILARLLYFFGLRRVYSRKFRTNLFENTITGLNIF